MQGYSAFAVLYMFLSSPRESKCSLLWALPLAYSLRYTLHTAIRYTYLYSYTAAASTRDARGGVATVYR